MAEKRVIVDTDPNIHVKARDIDDALAILFLLKSESVRLEGLTVNFGNVPADTGFAAARELVERTGAGIPVLKGATTRDELGAKNEAVEFLINTVNNCPGEISLLALAPLTNAATAMMLDERFIHNLKELVVMGGAREFIFFKHVGEFNFHCDGKAAATVTGAPREKSLITMDLCSQAIVTEKEMALLRENDSAMGRFMAGFVEPWYRLNRKLTIFQKERGFFPWDVVAAAYLEDPSLCDERQCAFTLRETGPRRGSFREFTETVQGGEKVSVNVPSKLDRERFMERMIARLTAW